MANLSTRLNDVINLITSKLNLLNTKKQDKLIPGSGISIASDSKTISAAVTSVANKTGNVSLTTTDIGGYVAPVNADWNASTGLSKINNKPSIPSKTSELTNDSGYITDISNKVDKIVGKQLSTEDYTSSEKNKLANLPSSVYSQIQTDLALSNKVDKINGKGLSTEDYTTTEKVKLTNLPSSVYSQFQADILLATKVNKETGKQLSTEDYSTAEKTKLAGIAAGATANSTDTQLRDRSTHTGIQAISTVNGLQAALDTKSPLVSPTFTGTPTAPTPVTTDNSTKLATTAWVKSQGYNNGDMLKAVYDTTNNGKVDEAESVPWEGVTNKPTTFTPSVHTHPVTEITGLGNAATKNIGSVAGTVAEGNHTHAIGSATSAGFVKLSTSNIIDTAANGIGATGSNPDPINTAVAVPQLENAVSQIKTYINTEDAYKVDKITGKGLSTEDFTTEEKNKLASITAGASININADWNATSGPSAILNKPAIPTKTSQLLNDTNFQTNTQVDAKIQALIGTAPAALDTLGEIAAQLQNDSSAISALITTVSNKSDTSYVDTQLATKVDKITGKSLSTNDYTNSDKAKVDALGTASTKNVPILGNASLSEVVLGDDTRLTNSRNPTGNAGGDLTGTYPNPTLITIIDNNTGSFKKVNVDAKGRVIGTASVTQTDITGLLGNGSITNAMLSNSAVANLSGSNSGDETTTSIKTKLGAASSVTEGYLTATDWNTFNNKQASLGYTPLAPANNLSDVSSVSQTRTNLGLGGAAVLNVGTTAGTVASGNDTRFTDSRTPSGAAGGDLTGTYPNPTLITVTDSGIGTFKKVTVDTKGRVTGTQAVAQADITGLLGTGSITNTMLANAAVANLSGTNTGDETATTIRTKVGNATSTNTGVLSSTDWSTFNGKQNALGYTPLNPSNNLSDVTTVATARTNLGLGTIATQNADTVAITGGTLAGLTGLAIRNGGTGAFDLTVAHSGTLTAARTLTLNVNDVARTVSLSGNLTVSNAATISGTNTGDQTISLTGDVTGSGTGSFATTLANSGVTAGTYKSVTVDTKGRVTGGTNPTTLAGYGITDAATSTHNHTLDSLSNVTITTKTTNDLIQWNGTAWVNKAASTLGYLTANQTITLSGDITGSGTTTITGTLATVTNSGTGTFQKITVDTKGRVTGTTAVAQSDITGLLGAGSITNTMLANSAVANLSGTNTGDQYIFDGGTP